MTHKRTRTLSDMIETVTPNYTIERTRKLHYKVTIRRDDKSATLFTSGTPSDHRAYYNFLSELKRKYEALKSPHSPPHDDGIPA